MLTSTAKEYAEYRTNYCIRDAVYCSCNVAMINGFTDTNAATHDQVGQEVCTPRLVVFAVTFAKESDEREYLIPTHSLQDIQDIIAPCTSMLKLTNAMVAKTSRYVK